MDRSYSDLVETGKEVLCNVNWGLESRCAKRSVSHLQVVLQLKSQLKCAAVNLVAMNRDRMDRLRTPQS